LLIIFNQAQGKTGNTHGTRNFDEMQPGLDYMQA